MKKQFVSILVFSILISLHINAQNSCLPDGITFTTQGQIDSFSINYPGCTQIEGSVILSSSNPGPDFDNLHGLSNIITIGGNLELGVLIGICGNSNLQVLNDTIGLESLKFIEGSLLIASNDIIDFSGFENLDSIGGDFYIISYELNSFVGFKNLQKIGGDFDISPCAIFTQPPGEIFSLQNFIGLDSLKSVGGDFRLRQTAVLWNFNGLENLTSIGGGMYLDRINYWSGFGNVELYGLENLESIGSDLVISTSEITNINSLGSIGMEKPDKLTTPFRFKVSTQTGVN